MAIIKRSAATDNPNIEILSTPEQIDVLSAEALMEALQGDDLEQILRAIHQLEAADSVEFQQHQAALLLCSIAIQNKTLAVMLFSHC